MPANQALPSRGGPGRVIHPCLTAAPGFLGRFPFLTGGSLILFCCRCYRSSPCCRGDSITKTNTRKTLRSRFQPSRLQTRRNENNLCNLNRINPNAPKGSGCLFLGCKHHQPGFTDDRPKVRSGVEVCLLYCELDQRWGRTNQHRAGLPSQRSSPPCSGSIRAPCSQISLVKTALRREALIAQWLTQHLGHLLAHRWWAGLGGRCTRRCGVPLRGHRGHQLGRSYPCCMNPGETPLAREHKASNCLGHAGRGERTMPMPGQHGGARLPRLAVRSRSERKAYLCLPL